MKKLKVTTPSEREVRMTRVFDAPRRLVFEALSRPELLKRWFGVIPGWTLVTCEVDMRTGGSYRYVWHGPGGIVMGMRGTYREVVPPERVVSTERFDEAWYPGEAVGTMVLTEQGGVTTLTTTILYESKEARDAVLRSPMEEGAGAGFDNLERLLATLREERKAGKR